MFRTLVESAIAYIEARTDYLEARDKDGTAGLWLKSAREEMTTAEAHLILAADAIDRALFAPISEDDDGAPRTS